MTPRTPHPRAFHPTPKVPVLTPNKVYTAPCIYVGIDPGASGGVAVISESGIAAYPVPATEVDVWKLFSTIKYMAPQKIVACIEQVRGFIGEEQPGSRAFEFGKSYGLLRMALTGHGINFSEVPPQTWQRALGIDPRRKGETKSHWKGRLRWNAQEMFPSMKVSLKIADAVLIAVYCKKRDRKEI